MPVYKLNGSESTARSAGSSSWYGGFAAQAEDLDAQAEAARTMPSLHVKKEPEDDDDMEEGMSQQMADDMMKLMTKLSSKGKIALPKAVKEAVEKSYTERPLYERIRAAANRIGKFQAKLKTLKDKQDSVKAAYKQYLDEMRAHHECKTKLHRSEAAQIKEAIDEAQFKLDEAKLEAKSLGEDLNVDLTQEDGIEEENDFYNHNNDAAAEARQREEQDAQEAALARQRHQAAAATAAAAMDAMAAMQQRAVQAAAQQQAADSLAAEAEAVQQHAAQAAAQLQTAANLAAEAEAFGHLLRAQSATVEVPDSSNDEDNEGERERSRSPSMRRTPEEDENNDGIAPRRSRRLKDRSLSRSVTSGAQRAPATTPETPGFRKASRSKEPGRRVPDVQIMD